MKTQYIVADEFVVKGSKVLVLDKDRVVSKATEYVLNADGKDYPYRLTHNDRWIIVDSSDNFRGKKIEL